MAQQAYIYALFDPRVPAEVRYVGKTIKPLPARLWNHISEARRSMDRCHRLHWIRALLSDGVEPHIRLLEEVDWAKWSDRERHWIAALRGSHPLTNSNDGGLGGHDPSPETRRRLRDANLGKRPSEETRQKMRLAKLGRPLTLEHRRKLSESQRQRAPMSAETRLKVSLAQKGRRKPPELVERMAASKRGRPLSLEHREKLRLATAKAWAEGRRVGQHLV